MSTLRLDRSADERMATLLVGRAQELERVSTLCAEPGQLITLTGMVGVGKSALARAFATTTERAAGVVDLDGITDARELWEKLPGIAGWDELGARLTQGDLTLLVLDNAEDAGFAISLQRQLSARAPELTLLTTRMEALRSAGELTLDVAPLAAPGPGEWDASSAELGAWPALELWLALTPTLGGDRDLRLGAQIVRALDGLPLALVLAAPRARLLGERKLLDALSDRFELLRRRPDMALRHEGLGAALDGLWQSLGATERHAVTALASFSVSFSFESGAAVLGLDELSFWDRLEQLTARGLVQHEPAPRDGGERRFRLLRSLRAYVRRDDERETELEGYARGHALHFCRWAASAPPFTQLCFEAENLQAAVSWLEAQATRSAEEQAAWLAGLLALVRLRWARGPHGELAERLERALAASPALPPPLRLRARVAQAADLRRAGELERAAALLELARRDLQGPAPPELKSETGAVEAAMGATREAEEALSAAVDDARMDAHERAKLQIRLADLLQRHSTHRRAHELLEAAITDCVARGDAELEVSARLNLANVWVAETAYEEAEAELDSARAVAEAMGHDYFQAYGLLARATLEQAAGRQGRALAEEAAAKLLQWGHARDAGVARSQLSLMALEAGDGKNAASHARAALRLLAAQAIPFRGLTRARYAAALAEEDRLSDAEEEWEAAWAELQADGSGSCAVAAQVHVGHLHLARRRAALAKGDAARARSHREQAEEALRLPTQEQELATEVRLARRLLEARLPQAEPGAGVCGVQRDGRSFTPPGEDTVDISRRGALRRILGRLATALHDSAGVGVTPEAIFEAGWPGQSIHPEQAGARVYNAIFELRRLGLGELLMRHDDGYLLRPDGVELTGSPP